MKTKLLKITLAILFLLPVCANAAGTWTTLDYPGAIWTVARDTSGSNIIGEYADTQNNRGGFLYNGTSWTSLPIIPDGIDGSNVVGDNTLYNITTQSSITLNYPGALEMGALGISGNNIVGWYMDGFYPFNYHGFVYNTTTETWTTLDYPGATHTEAYGISGSNIIGYAQDSSYNEYYFLYNGTSWTTLPIAASGIDGSNVVGGNTLYNITTQSSITLNYPGALEMNALGISGNNIVGWYKDSSGTHGFLYTIPEPATLLLLGLGAFLLRKSH